MYKVVSLFAGCGGADQGIIGGFEFNEKPYDRLPFNLVYALDIDQKALNTHKNNFVCDNVICEDICNVTSSSIPDHDVLIGGLDDKKYYFSKRAVEGMKRAKNNMKRGLAQDVDKPCLTVTSHLAKVSLNSRDPVLLVDAENELYHRFTPREAARIQSFPDSFEFVGSEIDAYRQIGNAIPPVMFWHVANTIAELLGQ